MRHLSLPLMALAALCALVAEERPCAAYQLQPISRVFAPSGSNATQAFELVNDGKERIALSVSFTTLERDESYVEHNQEADDEWLAYPSQLVLAPGARQTVRVTWLGDPRPDHELTYRMMVEQVPIERLDPEARPEAEAVGQMRVRLNYRGTLFVRPPHALPKVSLASAGPTRAPDGGDALALVLGNTGSAVANIKDCNVRLVPARGNDDAAAVELAATALAPLRHSRVLARTRRRYIVPWPAHLAHGPVVATVRCTLSP